MIRGVFGFYLVGCFVTLIALRSSQYRRFGAVAWAVDIWMTLTWPLMALVVFTVHLSDRDRRGKNP